MKNYLKRKLKEKEINLRNINDLISMLGKLSSKSSSVDNCVNEVKSGIYNGLKGDNTEALVSLAGEINKDNSKKISSSIQLAGSARSKIQKEIESIKDQIREIERQEAEERKRKEAAERKRKEEASKKGKK